MNVASEDWQQIVDDLREQLPEEARGIIDVEISRLVQRTIGQAGAEVRCDVDFLGNRVREGLQRIKASFLGQTLPPPTPALCTVEPLAVERDLVPARVSNIALYGYNLDSSGGIRLIHEAGGGTQTDVTSGLDFPTHYSATVNLGANGVQLSPSSRRLRVEHGGETLSTIAVIQPTTPVCRTDIVRPDPRTIDFTPPHVRGDRDFDGHGPTIITSWHGKVYDQRVDVELFVEAFESTDSGTPKSDYTTARGAITETLYNLDRPGWRIQSVLSPPLQDSHRYTDDDHSQDGFQLGSGGLVNSLMYVGDTGGDEAGLDTRVGVGFNRLVIEIVEIEGCVPDRALRGLEASGLINTATLRRLRTGMDASETLRANAGLNVLNNQP